MVATTRRQGKRGNHDNISSPRSLRARTTRRSSVDATMDSDSGVAEFTQDSEKNKLRVCRNVSNVKKERYNTEMTHDHKLIPQGFVCPLTMDIMYEPVIDYEGNTYEREAILEWLLENKTSPISRQPLTMKLLLPNISLRDTIHEYMGKQWVQEHQMEHQTRYEQQTLQNLLLRGENLNNDDTKSYDDENARVTSINNNNNVINGSSGSMSSSSGSGMTTTTTTVRENERTASGGMTAETTNAVKTRLRSRIDCFLQRASRELFDPTNSSTHNPQQTSSFNNTLQLNGQGYCAFRYDNVTIILDVPDHFGYFCLYTKNLIPDMCDKQHYTSEQRQAMVQRSMHLNFLQGKQMLIE